MNSPAGAVDPPQREKPTGHLSLLVIYTEQLTRCLEFYEGLGLLFAREQHGCGPVHYATTLPNGMVMELYPGRAQRRTNTLRLGFTLHADTVDPPLPPGRHLREDPDGRTVELHVLNSRTGDEHE